jgi:hypothetical protein
VPSLTPQFISQAIGLLKKAFLSDVSEEKSKAWRELCDMFLKTFPKPKDRGHE